MGLEGLHLHLSYPRYISQQHLLYLLMLPHGNIPSWNSQEGQGSMRSNGRPPLLGERPLEHGFHRLPFIRSGGIKNTYIPNRYQIAFYSRSTPCLPRGIYARRRKPLLPALISPHHIKIILVREDYVARRPESIFYKPACPGATTQEHYHAL